MRKLLYSLLIILVVEITVFCFRIVHMVSIPV